ncbi:uncharacterized protein LOC109846290 [Asparagus officinalis]|uniref:uncharacterized protein LOC109846290 n=1 Tax=Asparagus officinalis TaxID=4686 RepID=UPI00098DF9E9|nr:uncharacterized protein LOC109846290 [Asparagus officinalis]
MRPSSFPEGMTINSNLLKNTTCPNGTVLIRRTTKNDLIHAKTLQNHVKRHVTSYPSDKAKTSIGTGSHDPDEGNWWLTYGEERSLVGYWPKELFNNLEKSNEVDFGGAAYSPYNEPSPPMGSGHMPYEGPNRTCYFLNIKLVNKRNQLYSPKSVRVRLLSTRPNYYGIDGNYDSGYPDGYKFRYGGPGGYTRMKDV